MPEYFKTQKTNNAQRIVMYNANRRLLNIFTLVWLQNAYITYDHLTAYSKHVA